LTVQGEFLWGSNYTFLALVEYESFSLRGVYKPQRGQRPLWDFPADSLAKREVAAYLVSDALGWNLVPPTVLRESGPLGPGSLQLFIEHDPQIHYFTFTEQQRRHLRPVAAFDLLVNNADRKGSHILLDAENRLWCIDHGLCFHADDKLRTVVWDFVGEAIPRKLRKDLLKLKDQLALPVGVTGSLGEQLSLYLSQSEIEILTMRVEKYAALEHFPAPDPERRSFPWPQI